MKIARLLSNVGASSRACLAIASISLLALQLASCGGKIPATHYYTLKLPPPSPSADAKTNWVLEIDPFRAAVNLRDDRISYYESPTEFGFYDYHRWSPEPAEMVAELVKRRLGEMAVFEHVRRAPSHEPSDFRLAGRLLNFEEVDFESGGLARVALELRLIRTSDHKTVWSDRRQVEHPISQSGVAGVVDALSAASDQLLSQALPGLAAEVEREFQSKSGKPQ